MSDVDKNDQRDERILGIRPGQEDYLGQILCIAWGFICNKAVGDNYGCKLLQHQCRFYFQGYSMVQDGCLQRAITSYVPGQVLLIQSIDAGFSDKFCFSPRVTCCGNSNGCC